MNDKEDWDKTASELSAPDAEPDSHLPPGVARGHQPGDSPEQDQLTDGGIGPGAEGPGPDPNTRRLQEGRSFARVSQDPAGYEPIPKAPGET